MKAVVYTQYGSPDVLQLMDVAKPEPKDDQVLVKVRAASINALDYRRNRIGCTQLLSFFLILFTD